MNQHFKCLKWIQAIVRFHPILVHFVHFKCVSKRLVGGWCSNNRGPCVSKLQSLLSCGWIEGNELGVTSRVVINWTKYREQPHPNENRADFVCHFPLANSFNGNGFGLLSPFQRYCKRITNKGRETFQWAASAKSVQQNRFHWNLRIAQCVTQWIRHHLFAFQVKWNWEINKIPITRVSKYFHSAMDFSASPTFQRLSTLLCSMESNEIDVISRDNVESIQFIPLYRMHIVQYFDHLLAVAILHCTASQVAVQHNISIKLMLMTSRKNISFLR